MSGSQESAQFHTGPSALSAAAMVAAATATATATASVVALQEQGSQFSQVLDPGTPATKMAVHRHTHTRRARAFLITIVVVFVIKAI